MARRPFNDEPVSRLAAWSSRLAVFALVVAALSVVILRSNMLEIEPSLATVGAALILAALAIVLAFMAFVSIWRQGLAGLGRAILGLVLGLVLLAYPAYLAQRAYRYPAISDVTTDPANPPRYIALAAQRPKNRIVYPAANARPQRAAYPDLVPLQLTLPLRSSYDVVLGVLNKHKWPLVESAPPSGNRGEATIEATARTALMGFRDDIAIRITAAGNNSSRIDLRSASRFGWHDFGANASRLRSLLEEIDEASGNAPEPKPEPPPVKKPAPKRPGQKPKS